MKKIRTLHGIEIVKMGKVKKLIRDLQNGKKLPVIRCVDMGEYIKALEGTHRLLAYHIAGIEPSIEISNYDDVKNISIKNIIDETDGENDFSLGDTVSEVLERYETVGEDLDF